MSLPQQPCTVLHGFNSSGLVFLLFFWRGQICDFCVLISSTNEQVFENMKVSALCVVVIKLSTGFGTRVGAWVNHCLVQRCRLSIEKFGRVSC